MTGTHRGFVFFGGKKPGTPIPSPGEALLELQGRIATIAAPFIY